MYEPPDAAAKQHTAQPAFLERLTKQRLDAPAPKCKRARVGEGAELNSDEHVGRRQGFPLLSPR